MTRKEIDSYIVSIGGLVNGWKDTDVPLMYFPGDINVGWYPLVKELIEKLIEVGWDKHIFQIKEKFGGLRFYTGSCTDQQSKIIDEYEAKSYRICEQCGEPGIYRRDLPWQLTLCDKHYEEEKDRIQARWLKFQMDIPNNSPKNDGESDTIKEDIQS